MMINNILVGGIPTPLKNNGVKVSWDDDIPFPTFHGKSFKIPWFQSPPIRLLMIAPVFFGQSPFFSQIPVV